MKKKIVVLKEFHSMSESLSFIDFLSNEHMKAFRKREKSSLTVATVPAMVRGKEYCEVRCHYLPEQESEALWIEALANGVDPV